MFVPIGDENPLKRIKYQYVTVGLILANIVVFLLETTFSEPVLASFAVVPDELFQAILVGGQAATAADAIAIPERATLLTYMFLHGDFLHLAGNMLFLWVFGDNVEDDFGHARYLAFYLACGVAAGLMHAMMMPRSSDALIGASGAISGVIVAYLMMHPRVRVWVLVLKIIPVRITAAMALGLWIAFQVFMAIFPPAGQTAWWAHIGGFIAGAALTMILRPKADLAPGA